MANINRYTSLTPSRFNPMNFQEIIAAPMMKRKQHDDLLAQQDALRAGLAKVNPHEKYFDEAINLKQGINDQIQSQAEQLAKEGINPNSTSQFLQLSRNYNDLVSPTGKLGMINAHNINLQKTYNDYLKESVEAGNSPNIAKLHADQAIKQHMQTPLYDERGRVNDFKVDKGSVKFIDIPKRFQNYAKEAGMTSKDFANSSGALSFDQQGNRFVVNSSNRNMSADNIKQLQAVADLANREISDPSSEVRQSIDYNFRNPADVLKDVQQQLNIYRTNKSATERGSSMGSVDFADQKANTDGLPTGITEDVSLSDQVGKDLNALGNFTTSTSLTRPGIAYSSGEKAGRGGAALGGANESPQKATVEQKFKNNLSPEQQVRYMETLNAKKAQGLVPKNATPYSKEAIEAVRKDWTSRRNVNSSNKVIVPDSVENDILASPQLIGKDVNQRNGFIQTRLNVALGNKQKVLFNDKGKPVDLDDVDLKSVVLNGHYSPTNMLPSFGGNPNNSVSPHNITWTDKDGNNHTGLLTRDATEMNKPEFKAAKVINTTHKKAVENQGNFVSFNDKSLPELKRAGLSGMRVKYDNANNTYTVEAFQNNKLLEKSAPMSPEQYQNAIYNIIK